MPTDNNKTSTATVEEATCALANLGVTGAIDLSVEHDPDLILGWCRWAEDGRRAGQNIQPGLIVMKIRREEQPPKRGTSATATAAERKHAEFRQRFRAKVLPFPPGSVCEKHATAERRRRRAKGMEEWDDLFPEDRPADAVAPIEVELCAGDLIVTARAGMVLMAQCDRCGEEIGYPLRAIAVLPDAPLAQGRKLPDAPAPPTPPEGWFRGESDGLRKLDPAAAIRDVEPVAAEASAA